jgi:hypothetical protein
MDIELFRSPLSWHNAEAHRLVIELIAAQLVERVDAEQSIHIVAGG